MWKSLWVQTVLYQWKKKKSRKSKPGCTLKIYWNGLNSLLWIGKVSSLTGKLQGQWNANDRCVLCLKGWHQLKVACSEQRISWLTGTLICNLSEFSKYLFRKALSVFCWNKVLYFQSMEDQWSYYVNNERPVATLVKVHGKILSDFS